MKPISTLVIAAVATVGPACCGVGRNGASVAFTGQTNLIVWDKDHGIEHFVRDASFATKASDLGFIAPTPGRPTLSAVDPNVFSELEGLRPVSRATTSVTAATGAVEILEARDVAGYHATVLRAADGESLTAWLKSNEYPVSKSLIAWVEPYVRRKWYLTAFKVTGGTTRPIRMSFETRTPFNPYSVPAENGSPGATLRLYYVSAGNEVPLIGQRNSWRKPMWSATLSSDAAAQLADSLYLTPDKIPEQARLTYYQDDLFGHPGFDDLYFVDDPTPVWAVAGVSVSASIIVGFVLVRRRRNALAT